MRIKWWKWLSIILISYGLIGGLLLPVPRLHILNESIRNLYYHVPMWFVMIFLFAAAAFYALRYLKTDRIKDDLISAELTKVGVWFSVFGMVTGMIWAQFTWGEAWSNDPKQLGTAMGMLIYFAYLILRTGIKEEDKRARISAVYNIFAFALIIPLLYILPKQVDSLHPGSGGNPGFNQYDLDERMRWVFYPAILGWILFGLWLTDLSIRMNWTKYQNEQSN